MPTPRNSTTHHHRIQVKSPHLLIPPSSLPSPKSQTLQLVPLPPNGPNLHPLHQHPILPLRLLHPLRRRHHSPQRLHLHPPLLNRLFRPPPRRPRRPHSRPENDHQHPTRLSPCRCRNPTIRNHNLGQQQQQRQQRHYMASDRTNCHRQRSPLQRAPSPPQPSQPSSPPHAPSSAYPATLAPSPRPNPSTSSSSTATP